jgi:hypothetical protein
LPFLFAKVRGGILVCVKHHFSRTLPTRSPLVSRIATGLALVTLGAMTTADAAQFLSAERELRARFGERWQELPQAVRSDFIREIATSLEVGGALDLGDIECGTLDLRGVADGVQVTGGRDGTVVFGGGQHGISLLFSQLNQRIEPRVERPFAMLDPLRADRQFAAKEWTFKDGAMFGSKLAPMSDYLALFCSGGIRIKSDVKNCAWIAGDNAFGDHVVTAEARVDDSLFLWFGLNWPFRDYNAHWTDGGKTDWVKRGTQMHFDLKGGGAGTRLYHMVETNYGNPGVGVLLENTKGLTLMQGSTERSSAQGPGVYWLRNCEDTLLGLRGINAFGSNKGDIRNADANRDITIDGGRGNRLYAMRTWSNANDASLVNSDPELQQWCVASQYGQRGVENTLRYAVTPYYNRPTAEFLAKFDVKAHAQAIYDSRAAALRKDWEKKKADAEKKNQAFTMPEPKPHESVEQLIAKIKTGRHLDSPGVIEMNATDEETFMLGAQDLTKGPAGKVPPPPDVPPTDAPRTRKVIAFTQQPDFGKSLLAAGADPTGRKPSDDAFAKVLYGMNRAELQALLDEADVADKALWAMHGGNEEKLKAARETADFKTNRAKIAGVMKRIAARKDTAKAAAEARVKELGTAIDAAKKAKDDAKKNALEAERDLVERESRSGSVRLEIPAGTFLLKQPLYLLGGISGVWGTGEKSILKTDAPIHLMKMQERTTVAQLAFEGGSVGLALTGADHHYSDGAPTKKSYIAGENFYALTFRNQTLAGMLIGNDDPGIMGGAEHDQNKYVDLKFENTGDYGICMNGSMLDKWLVLHSEFRGQKKAGIAVKFNNLIHGMIVGSRFESITGPSVDTFGGNVEIGYRPWEVWIDQCEFIECGSATQPAVEMGITELSAFTHNKISTKKKPIAGGFAGSPQIFEDCTIDVTLADGAPGVKLRAVRLESVVRANGHVVRNVKANGPLVFINDANSQTEHFAKTIGMLTAQGKPHVTKWDTNTMTTTLAPKNGWIHPFLFHETEIGTEKFPYALLNVDIDAGKVKQRIDLTK